MPSMASIVPQLYPDNPFLADHFFEFSSPTIAAGSLQDNKLVSLFDHINGGFDYMVPDCNRDMMMSSASMPSLSQQLGSASELDMLACPDYSADFHHGISDHNFNNGGYQLQENGVAYPIAAKENWGIQCNQEMSTVEEPQVKVGRYTEEERKERILRYLKKRTQRNFNKTIKYSCRKTLADRRVRVRGRFAKNVDSCEREEFPVKKDGNMNPYEEDFYLANTKFQNDVEEEWLQANMANLVHLFYSFPDATFI